MTLSEILLSIPGLMTIALFGPILLIVAIKIAQDFTEWTIDTVQSFQKEAKEVTPPKGQNVIDFETMAAISHIRNHEAMKFVSKA